MAISKLDLMKLSELYDGEFCLADFTEEEIGRLLGNIEEGMSVDQIREKYFEFYDDIKDRTLEKHKWSD